MAESKKMKKLVSSKFKSKLGAVEKKGQKKLGHYSFLVGIVLAIIVGIFVDPSLPRMKPFVEIIVPILVVLGIIVGFLNITAKETLGFLIASIALLMVGTANLTFIKWGIGLTLQAMLVYIRVFVAPAALIVAIKTIKVMAED